MTPSKNRTTAVSVVFRSGGCVRADVRGPKRDGQNDRFRSEFRCDLQVPVPSSKTDTPSSTFSVLSPVPVSLPTTLNPVSTVERPYKVFFYLLMTRSRDLPSQEKRGDISKD